MHRNPIILIPFRKNIVLGKLVISIPWTHRVDRDEEKWSEMSEWLPFQLEGLLPGSWSPFMVEWEPWPTNGDPGLPSPNLRPGKQEPIGWGFLVFVLFYHKVCSWISWCMFHMFFARMIMTHGILWPLMAYIDLSWQSRTPTEGHDRCFLWMAGTTWRTDGPRSLQTTPHFVRHWDLCCQTNSLIMYAENSLQSCP